MILLPMILLAHIPPFVSDDGTNTDKLLARVESLAKEAVEKDGVPGISIAVGRGGELLVAEGFGYADAKRGIPATADTSYPIGSLTRQFTAVAILQLAERKKLALEDELAKWLPEFPLDGRKVTIQNLLSNTSGVPGYEKLAAIHGAKLDRPLSNEEIFALFRDVPFDFAPGTSFATNNSGYFLLSLIVTKASGQNYTEYVREHVLEPIGLEVTRFDPWDERKVGFARDCRELSEQRELEIPLLGSATSTQSLSSTVKDLFRWQCAIDGRVLIDDRSTRLMLTPSELEDGWPIGYGFATEVRTDGSTHTTSHVGGLGGFRVSLTHYEPSGLTIVVLANCSTAPVERIERAIARAAMDLLPAEIADLPLDPAELRRYVGTWQIATSRVHTVARDGKLWFEGAGEAPFALLYQGQHQFVASTDGGMRFTFKGQADARAETFEIARNGLVSVGKRMD